MFCDFGGLGSEASDILSENSDNVGKIHREDPEALCLQIPISSCDRPKMIATLFSMHTA